jgi:Ferritin-like domain
MKITFDIPTRAFSLQSSSSHIFPAFPLVILLLHISIMASILPAVAVALLISAASALPASITGSAITPQVTQLAGGGIPVNNNPPAAQLSQNAVSSFELANFLENLESNFFQNGLANLTAWGTAGYTNGVSNLDVVAAVAAQEEVHVANLVKVITGNGGQAIVPCQYQFPVSDAPSFYALANIITSVGIGALIDLEANVAPTDPGVIPAVGSIVPVESRHDAFFRLTANEHPNPTAFETRISGTWAYNLALDFIVADSCTNLPVSISSLPVFPDIQVINAGPPSFAAKNGEPGSLTFTVLTPSQMYTHWNTSGPLYMGWVDAANSPVYTSVTHVGNGDFMADIPSGLFGMAFAALTNQNTATNVADLTKATVAGPLPMPVS